LCRCKGGAEDRAGPEVVQRWCIVAELQSRCKGSELLVVRAGESCCRGAEEMQRKCIGSGVQVCRYGDVDEAAEMKGWCRGGAEV